MTDSQGIEDDGTGTELPDSLVTVDVDDDGAVHITIGGSGEDEPEPDDDVAPHDRNLAQRMEDEDLAVLAGDLIRLIDLDDQSREEWVARRSREVEMLGIAPETPREAGDADGGMSRVRHPMLLDAVLRFQANARGELLPVDGPAKIRIDHPDDQQIAPNGMGLTDLAEAFEADINVYLTETATEYVPSTDKMLFGLGLSGMSFRKTYHCPLRRRPVIEAVNAVDIVVSNDIEDIRNASRVTHVIKMRQATVRRMQLAGAYRDVSMTEPGYEEAGGFEATARDADGVTEVTIDPEDRERTILECYCELDLKGYEDEEDGQITGLPLPYKVVIDKSDRTVLEIRRNWRVDDAMKTARQVIVPWVFVPWHGGFWGLGLGSILNGSTAAATAGWRIMFDTGMQNAFPGGFVDKSFLRGQDSANFRVTPGSYWPVETGSKSLQDVIFPLPQRSMDGAFMELVQNVVETGQKLGGAAEISVGEGKQDAPVGTTIALIEQATKVMDAVHKRLCQAQGRELELLVELFEEDPEAFWRGNANPATEWDRETLLFALKTFGLQPQADPNTSSHMQRVMAAQGLLQLATTAPTYFDGVEVIKHYLKMIRVPNAERFIAPNAPPPGFAPPPKGGAGGAKPPDPVASQAQMISAQANAARAKAAQQDADTRSQQAQGTLALGAAKLHAESNDPSKVAGAQADMVNAQTDRLDAENRSKEIAVDQRNNELDAANDAADRQAEDQRERERLAFEAAKHGTSVAVDLHKHASSLEQAGDHHDADLKQADRHRKADSADAAKDRKAQRSKPGGLGGAK